MAKVKQADLTKHHPKAADASAEKVRRLAGIVRLTRPVPSVQFLEKLGDDQPARRARD
ncbi:MAG TPA: hypothetical protein VK066_25885 [Chloroflexota bacterium]|nr:hypothetical protein [Chloroflexota bacterium]